jgi:3-deoxy-D-manno-octulosonate 8-phosphate phosphatase (KDO 8-P phosphatase)
VPRQVAGDSGSPDDPVLRRAALIEAILLDVDGVLTDGTFEPGDEGAGIRERKRFHSRDGLGLVMAKRCGMRLGFITGRPSGAVRGRAAELSLEFLREGCFDKGPAFEEACAAFGLRPEQVAFVGDDVQDLPALRRAGFAAAPADAHPAVLDSVHFVAEAPGGHGAVRQIIERILEARGLLDRALFRLWG